MTVRIRERLCEPGNDFANWGTTLRTGKRLCELGNGGGKPTPKPSSKNELGWLGIGFFPQSEKLRITERFRRSDLGHLEVETTYDDPSTFKKPFTVRRVNSLAAKDWEVLEYVCAENNRDLEHI